jgi:hypothetical protein
VQWRETFEKSGNAQERRREREKGDQVSPAHSPQPCEDRVALERLSNRSRTSIANVIIFKTVQ